MNKKSKIFFLLLTLLVFFATAYTYYETVVLRRFDVFVSEEEIPTYEDLFGEVTALFNSYVQ